MLKRDLKNDRFILNNEHGVSIDEVGKRNLKIFDRYANMKLSEFKFFKWKIGVNQISRWTRPGKTKLEIYQVESTIEADSAYDEKDINTGVIKKTRLKKGVFIKFRTYIINRVNYPQLIYLTQKGEGLISYNIGKQTFGPSREDILLGVRYPDNKQIFESIANKKYDR
jgi:hypothetical protein